MKKKCMMKRDPERCFIWTIPPLLPSGLWRPSPHFPWGKAWLISRHGMPLSFYCGALGGGQGQASPSTYTCRTSPAPMACYTVRWLQLATGLLGIQNPPLPLPGGHPRCPEGGNSLAVVLCWERFGSLKWWFSKWSAIQMLPSHNL